MAVLTRGRVTITVPDDVADDYLKDGWARPGVPALPEPPVAPKRRPATRRRR